MELCGLSLSLSRSCTTGSKAERQHKFFAVILSGSAFHRQPYALERRGRVKVLHVP